MLWFVSLLLYATDGPPKFPWQDSRFEIVDVMGMESPTSLLFVDGRLLASGDLDEAFAGVYSLSRKKQGYQAQLLKYLPQMDVDDLHFDRDTGQLRVVMGRRFSAEPSDWVGQFMALEPGQLRPAEIAPLNIPPLCFDKSMRCGLVAFFPLNEATWVAVKKQDPSTLYLFEKRNSEWYQRASASLTFKRRFVAVTAVRQRENQLLFLLKDQWLLASLATEKLLGELPGELRLEPVFSMKHLVRELRIQDRNLEASGMAEGFDIDKQGRLLVVLNNRTKPFLGVAGAAPTNRPKIVIYTSRE